MATPGARVFPLKGEGAWGGMTTLSRSMPGQFELMENVYVCRGGSEVRMWPGFKCVADPVSSLRTAGYQQNTVEALRPVVGTTASEYTAFQENAPTQTLVTWSDPVHIHGFERVRDRWIIFGEAGFRREPLQRIADTQAVTVTGWAFVSGSETDITLSDTVRLGPDNPNEFNGTTPSRSDGTNDDQPGDWVYITGLTGNGASLNGATHRVISVTNGAVGTVRIATGVTSGSATGETGTIERVTQPLDTLGWINGETPPTDIGNSISNDEESLAIWTVVDGLDTESDTPTATAYPAHVANRHRDFGDFTDNIYEGINISTLHPNTPVWDAAFSRRRQVNIPRRIVPHVAGDRLIMVTPGYMCNFQAPALIPINYSTGASTAAGLGWQGNEIYDKPRCIGVPKATMLEDDGIDDATGWHKYTAPNATLAFAGTDPSVSGRAGRYSFKFAYHDEGTGETGLVSEPIEVNIEDEGIPFRGIRFAILYPGYLMHECMATTIYCYRTEKNGSVFYFDRAIKMRGHEGNDTQIFNTSDFSAKYGTKPNTKRNSEPNEVAVNGGDNGPVYYHCVHYQAVYETDEQLRKNVGAEPIINQMPMGHKCARTIRGFTLYGGALGNAGRRLELMRGNFSVANDRVTAGISGASVERNEIYFRCNRDFPHPYGDDRSFPCGSGIIPPAYQGQQIFSRQAFPYPAEIARLDKMVNNKVEHGGLGNLTKAIDTPSDQFVRFSLDEVVMPEDNKVDSRGSEGFLVLPRGKISISEADNPGIVSSILTTVVANEGDEDIEGIGSYMGHAIIATRSRSYMLGFSTSPAGVSPEISSDRFGCICANSMVEFDNGTAWLSDRGPVAMINGQFQFIGQSLERFFIGSTSRYKRDSQGMMQHSWAAHDAERGLIIFGLFADRNEDVTVTYRGVEYNWDTKVGDTATPTPDEARSRFPCDEMLVFSYTTGAWTVWRPPSGQEVLWMSYGPDADGDSRLFFMMVDKRIYAMDDTYSMFNKEPPSMFTTAASTGTTITVTNGSFATNAASLGNDPTNGNKYIKAGMPIVIHDSSGNYIGQSTIASFNDDAVDTITMNDAITVESGYLVSIGVRTAKIWTNFINPKQSTQEAHASKVAMRHTVWDRFSNDPGLTPPPLPQSAWVNCQVFANRRLQQVDGDPTFDLTNLTAGETADTYDYIGTTENIDVVREVGFSRGRIEGQNLQVRIDMIGGAQIRIQDLRLEAM